MWGTVLKLILGIAVAAVLGGLILTGFQSCDRAQQRGGCILKARDTICVDKGFTRAIPKGLLREIFMDEFQCLTSDGTKSASFADTITDALCPEVGTQ